MSKVDYSGVPEAGSEWELDGLVVTVLGFEKKGRGGYVHWAHPNGSGKEKWSEFRKKAKAA